MLDSSTLAAIQLTKVSKQYRGIHSYALKDVSLRVLPGEVYGFLGANGAGKTTTIRLLLNFIQPTSGKATIHNLDVVRDSIAAKRHVGYLAGEVALYSRTTGRELLTYLQALQPLKNKSYFIGLIEAFELELDRPINQLSKGNRQKLGIVQALMHEPEVLILDEPTSGLDPIMQEMFYEVIIERKQRGTAVFVSSHNMAEVQQMCDRVGIIKDGAMVTEQKVSDLHNSSNQQYVIEFAGTVPANLSSVANILTQTKNKVTVSVTSLAPFLAFLAKQNIRTLTSARTDLGKEFLHVYEDEK